MRDSRLEAFNWNKLSQSDLVGLAFALRPQREIQLFPDYAKGLHAWFLQQIQRFDPELSRYLHDSQTEKAFTISRLDGPLQGRNEGLWLNPQNTYYWYFALLSRDVIQGVLPWLQDLPETLLLARHSLAITSVKTFLPCRTYSDLYQAAPGQTLSLSFLSPTSFRRRGNHFPLPVPSNLFHSYLRRWNLFSGYAVAEEAFLEWVEDHVRIDRHWLESLTVPGGKRGNFTGFMGSITFSLSPQGQKNTTYTQLFQSLGQFAPYCGTGHKTTFGLGQTRLGWQDPQESCLALAQQALQESSLANRVETLTEQLLQHKKRMGGERALKICHTQAEILARKEQGESLLAIAADLELGYETVKTYSKRAQRLLRSS
jgi:CRISPR-associated endoribonuclease Cas6